MEIIDFLLESESDRYTASIYVLLALIIISVIYMKFFKKED